MTSRNVITIATSTGAQAEDIGRGLAKQLGYRYINEEVIFRAARKARVSPEEIDRVEHTQPLADRIFQALAALPDAVIDYPGPEQEAAAEFFGFTPTLQWHDGPKPTPSHHREVLHRNLIREVLWEVGLEGQAVIVAHGAGMQLAGMANVLRVFVTASADTRVDRLAAAEQLPPREARRRVEHTDSERKAYLRRFYEVTQELPTHYDLVVNTDKLSAEAAVQVIAAAVGQPEPARSALTA
jgi:cytidylate kinase